MNARPAIRLSLICLALALVILAAPALRAQTPAPPSASDILTQAKTQATTEHKNILLVFSASWCGPCREFEAFLDDPKTGPIMAKYFVTARFDVGEKPGDQRHADTPGAEFLRASLGGAAAGYPYILIANAQAETIVNSYRPVPGNKSGDNIGYPALPVEIDWFMKMLQKSTPSMSPDEAATIKHWLDRHGHS
jgi:thiol-disulfide isomerase/thioredoxin